MTLHVNKIWMVFPSFCSFFTYSRICVVQHWDLLLFLYKPISLKNLCKSAKQSELTAATERTDQNPGCNSRLQEIQPISSDQKLQILISVGKFPYQRALSALTHEHVRPRARLHAGRMGNEGGERWRRVAGGLFTEEMIFRSLALL